MRGKYTPILPLHKKVRTQSNSTQFEFCRVARLALREGNSPPLLRAICPQQKKRTELKLLRNRRIVRGHWCRVRDIRIVKSFVKVDQKKVARERRKKRRVSRMRDARHSRWCARRKCTRGHRKITSPSISSSRFAPRGGLRLPKEGGYDAELEKQRSSHRLHSFAVT